MPASWGVDRRDRPSEGRSVVAQHSDNIVIFLLDRTEGRGGTSRVRNARRFPLSGSCVSSRLWWWNLYSGRSPFRGVWFEPVARNDRTTEAKPW